ncbi:uncharacterized protein LOC112139886 [Oryzias melastigma]|uniref:uncharacterized protein LOC112139886 n=1 Tax=Oryzias melastigma TaxID=30732 RepID=UPI00168CF05E|nr:uncharacterized protein LOC112139886 [Oryzias melastigma]
MANKPKAQLIRKGRTLSCSVNPSSSGWSYSFYRGEKNDKLLTVINTDYHLNREIKDSQGGVYRCRGGRGEPVYYTEFSDPITVDDRSRLTAGTTTVSVGDRVTLSCSVEKSAGWKYEWFRRTSHTSEYRINDGENGNIRVSQGGIYRCRGSRGESTIYSDKSDEVTISITFSNKVSVTQKPSWSQMFRGETITLTCEVQGGEGVQWEYEWRTPQSQTFRTNRKVWTFTASISGDYSCKSRSTDDSYSGTKWSEAVRVSVSDLKPEPVLRVSPRWSSPGSSVTLSCEVEHVSAGWSFYWYKAVPDLSHKSGSYSYELLPASSNGTADNSYIIHGQTHTAGYVCRAGRGEPHVYTLYSQPHFVWSGDLHPSASLSVSPDRVQHFTSDSLSLTCEGNSAEWRVGSFLLPDLLSFCSDWGTMNGSTCHVQKIQSSNAVFWCESGSAFSNAVNITGHNDDLILLSPVHPVTEGHSVTLGCKWRTENLLSKVFFYQNDTLIQSESRVEMIIPAVSKSHEGFYKCQSSGKESPQSWLAVTSASRPDSSSLPVLLIVGPVCVFLLMIFLLMFYLYRKSKGEIFFFKNHFDDYMISQFCCSS